MDNGVVYVIDDFGSWNMMYKKVPLIIHSPDFPNFSSVFLTIFNSSRVSANLAFRSLAEITSSVKCR